jgi:hypothetical protein
MDAGTLHQKIAEVSPITSARVGILADRTTWSWEPGPNATQQQIDAGNTILTTFDFAGADAAAAARAVGLNSDSAYLDFVSQLQGKTAAQVKTYVQNNVTDLASAKLLLAKVLLYIARAL